MTATKKNIPGKRLKTWWRNRHVKVASQSFRSFARDLIANGTAEQKTAALAWAGGKVAP
jgi:hypothetical protein